MKILSASFIKSSPRVQDCPPADQAEYAFIGRSNVGKSSLINMLTSRKGLALTSQQPGKTQLINHFQINDNWYLVDLPGYGYAKKSLQQRLEFRKMITDYILYRESLVNLFILIDIRHEPQKIDLEFINEMGAQQVPFSLVFTKVDKLSRQAQQDSLERYKQRLLEDWEELPPIFLTSATKQIGRDELLDYIDQLNLSFCRI